MHRQGLEDGRCGLPAAHRRGPGTEFPAECLGETFFAIVATCLGDLGKGFVAVPSLRLALKYPWIPKSRPAFGDVGLGLIGFSDMTLPSGGFEGVCVVGVDRELQPGARAK